MNFSIKLNKNILRGIILISVNIAFFTMAISSYAQTTVDKVRAYMSEYGFDQRPRGGDSPEAQQLYIALQDFMAAKYEGDLNPQELTRDLRQHPENYTEFFNKFSDFTDEEFTSSTYNPQPLPGQGDFSDPTKSNFQIVPAGCFGFGGSLSATNRDYGKCGWKDLIILLNVLVKFMAYIAASLSALAFGYAGFLYMTAAGDSGKIEQAHGIFKKTFTGIFFVLVGWLLIATLLKVLDVGQNFSMLNLSNVKAPTQ
jgi:hypothetical protein